MLAADKLQLQSSLKQQATALKEKEFNLHHSNLMTVGTQAAVLAGLDITMFIEFQPPPNSAWSPEWIGRGLKFIYYLTITSAFCANMLVVANTTVLSVLGAGMALRGPDGSMMTATDGLYEERTSVFGAFGVGLAATLCSVVLCVWVTLHWEAALFCMCITLYTCRKVYTNYQRICKRFGFDESETVDFSDIFDGPANIRYLTRKITGKRSKRSSDKNNHRNHQHHHHQSDKKSTPQRSNNHQKNNINTGVNEEKGGRYWFQKHHSMPSYPNDDASGTDDEEMATFIPQNSKNNSDSRLGVAQRRGGNGSWGSHQSVHSYGSDSSPNGGDYDDMRIV